MSFSIASTGKSNRRWLGNLDKFGAGDRGFWIEAFTGGRYTIDRVKHGNKPVHVPHLSVAVMGGIQPDRLQSLLMRGDDDGLASRFLMAWPEPQLPTRPTGAFDLGSRSSQPRTHSPDRSLPGLFVVLSDLRKIPTEYAIH